MVRTGGVASFVSVLVVIVSAVVAYPAAAQQDAAAPVTAGISGAQEPVQEKPDTKDQEAERERLKDLYAGWGFGAGLSFSKDRGRRDPVEEAIIDEQGIVRISKRRSSIARIMLEAHYFWTPGKAGRYGVGPFVAVQPGTNDIISAIGGGLMLGLRQIDQTRSFNLGFGIVADPQAKVLGRPFQEGQPAPRDADGKPVSIRYEEDDQFGWLFMFSFAW